MRVNDRMPRQWRSETRRGEGETLETRYRVYVEAMPAGEWLKKQAARGE